MRGRNITDQDKPVWHYVIDPNEIARDEDPVKRLANLHKTGHHESQDGHAII